MRIIRKNKIMNNEVIRVHEDKNIIIYKRIKRDSKGVMPYFASGKGVDENNVYLEFRDIRGVKAFIKSIEDEHLKNILPTKADFDLLLK